MKPTPLRFTVAARRSIASGRCVNCGLPVGTGAILSTLPWVVLHLTSECGR